MQANRAWLQLVAIMIFIAAPSSAPSQDEIYQDNVVIILDASGSMNRPMGRTRIKKMTAAKDATGLDGMLPIAEWERDAVITGRSHT